MPQQAELLVCRIGGVVLQAEPKKLHQSVTVFCKPLSADEDQSLCILTGITNSDRKLSSATV